MTLDSVVTIRTADYLAVLSVAGEVASLLHAVGKGEVVDRTAIGAARALSLSLLKRINGMKPGGPHFHNDRR